ncbi:MAG: A/G-specific adenine glycosylase [Saprospiraceae bacterium]
MSKSIFPELLLDWYEPKRRPLPWKDISDPYLIWLSEIILQQTRVAQGLPYFEAFRRSFPTVASLASASEDEIFKHWEGLGYYARARNLHRAAKQVVAVFGGQFPTTYKELLSLPGVGPYTAAAIASFAYGLPHAVLDGNVFRVLSRFFDIDLPIDSTIGKKAFQQLAQELLPEEQSAFYNQAMMDLGATVCTPQSPLCQTCPMYEHCQAYQKGITALRPVKSKRIAIKNRYFNFLVINHRGESLLQQRTANDIWNGLYQFPLIETPTAIEQFEDILQHDTFPEWLPTAAITSHQHGGSYTQQLTHQRIHARFWHINLLPECELKTAAIFTRAEPKNWCNFAFPKVISWFIDEKQLH